MLDIAVDHRTAQRKPGYLVGAGSIAGDGIARKRRQGTRVGAVVVRARSVRSEGDREDRHPDARKFRDAMVAGQ